MRKAQHHTPFPTDRGKVLLQNSHPEGTQHKITRNTRLSPTRKFRGQHGFSQNKFRGQHGFS